MGDEMMKKLNDGIGRIENLITAGAKEKKKHKKKKKRRDSDSDSSDSSSDDGRKAKKPPHWYAPPFPYPSFPPPYGPPHPPPPFGKSTKSILLVTMIKRKYLPRDL
jgi:hypothetical protein